MYVCTYLISFSGSTETFSAIYKYNVDIEQFVSFQNISSYGAVDIKHFVFEHNNIRQNFIAIANSVELSYDGSKSSEAFSIIYKFVDTQFVPFQRLDFYAIRQFLPVTGSNNEFCLLVACENHAIEVYQYDGWKFKKSTSYQTGDAFGKGISKMRTVALNGTTAVVIANQLLFNEHVNIFIPKYLLKNPVKSIHTSMFKWCESKLANGRVKRAKELSLQLQDLPKVTDKFIHFTNGVQFRNLTVRNLTTKSVTTPDGRLDKKYFESVNKLKLKFDKINEKIKKLEKSIAKDSNRSKFGNATLGIERDELPVHTIEVENLVLENNVEVEYFNGHPISDLLHTNDNITVNTLTADTVIVKRGINVGNTINGVIFDDSNILLPDGNQTLDGEFEVNKLFVNNFRANKVNNISTDAPPLEPRFYDETLYYKNIIVNNLTLNGLINNISLDHFVENTLKTSGNQTITAPVYIRNLTTQNVYTESTISGVNVSDIVRNEEGASFDIDQDIQFTQGIEGNELYVRDRINNIKIINNKFDALLIDSPEEQVITGYKIFENVTFVEQMQIYGKIKSKIFKKYNPIFTTDESINLEGDYIINGDTTIVELLKVREMHGNDPTLTASRVLKHGLRLDANRTNINFNFVQPIQANNAYTNRINGLNSRGFLRMGINETQIVTAKKTFVGNLTVDGNAHAHVINKINIKELNDNTLKKNSNQTITGRLRVKSIRAKR